MPRTARQKIETNTYHIMMRGIDRQIIFEDASDKRKYLELISDYKTKLGFELFAYCLMDNHIHLLVREHDTLLESVFRKLNTSYAVYYNIKHGRCGHLFQDRYKSEGIKNDPQFLQTLRYIHLNPVKACICNDPEFFEFSSYNEYVYPHSHSICDTGLILEMMGSINGFIGFHKEPADYECMDIDRAARVRIDDEKAISILHQITNESDIKTFKELETTKRNTIIKALRQNHLSIKQINRLTGFSVDVIKKISIKTVL